MLRSLEVYGDVGVASLFRVGFADEKVTSIPFGLANANIGSPEQICQTEPRTRQSTTSQIPIARSKIGFNIFTPANRCPCWSK